MIRCILFRKKRKKTFPNLEGIIFLNLIPSTWLRRSKKGKNRRNPTSASFAHLSEDADYVSWTKTMPRTPPNMQLWPMAVNNKPLEGVATSLRDRFPTSKNTESVPSNAGRKLVTMSSYGEDQFHWLQKQFGYSVPPAQATNIHWQENKSHAYSWTWNVFFPPVNPYTK